jgi:hypothetical protein
MLHNPLCMDTKELKKGNMFDLMEYIIGFTHTMFHLH